MRNILAFVLVLFAFVTTANANPVNLGDKLNVVSAIPAAAITADGNGTGIDLRVYDGEIALLLNSAIGTGNADNTLDLKIQESADNSAFADVVGATFTQVTNAASVQKMSLNKDELKRYIRVVKDVGGTTPSFIAGVVMVANKKYE